MKNIFIITWDHPFNAVDGPAQLISEGLRLNGCRVTIANMSTDEGRGVILRMLTEKVDLVIGMGPHSLFLYINGKLLHQAVDTKFAILFLDNPFYSRVQWSFLFNSGFPEDSLLLCVDAKQEKQLRAICDHLHGAKFITQFFPWGGHINLGKMLGHTEKLYDLVIFSTLDQQISQSFCLNDNYDGVISESVCEAAGISHSHLNEELQLLSKGYYSVDIVEFIGKEMHLEFPTISPNSEALITEVDSFLKRYRRLAITQVMLKTAIESNYKVAIFGTGWERLGDLPENIKVFGPVSYSNQFDIFKSSRTVINTDPNWVAGVHDRVFNAFGSGCVAITNENYFTDLNFNDGVDCIIYQNSEVASKKIVQAVENYENIANNAYRLLVLNHTWKDRCSTLVSYLDYVI